MKKALFLNLSLLFFLLISAPQAKAATCNVGGAKSAYKTIQKAINTTSCTTIQVASGTFYENIVIPASSRSITIIGAKYTFATSAGAPTSRPTIIDGRSLGIVISVGSGVTLTLKGIRIQNGQSTYGGGIYNQGTLIFDHVTLYNNLSTDYGGGIYSAGKDLIITSSKFENNTSYYGGAIAFSDKSSATSTTVSISDSEFSQNLANYSGGALQFNLSTVSNVTSITNTSFTLNEAINNGASIRIANSIPSSSSYSAQIAITECDFSYGKTTSSTGGAIHLGGSGVTEVVIEGSTFDQNYTKTNGGAIYASLANGTVDINSTSFTDNTCAGEGASVYMKTLEVNIEESFFDLNISSSSSFNSGSMIETTTSVDVNSSSFIDNSAIQIQSTDLLITNSTFARNQSSDNAIDFNFDVMVVDHSTFSQNSSISDESILFEGDSLSTATFLNTTIYQNSSGTKYALSLSGNFEIANTIISNSATYNCAAVTTGSIVDLGHNLVYGTDDCDLIDSSTVTGISPDLGTLSDNGGLTQTHLPNASSPVIDGANNTYSTVYSTTDQRGYSRIVNTYADIGAVEVQ